jgi:hypothetical protein
VTNVTIAFFLGLGIGFAFGLFVDFILNGGR